MRRVTFGWLIFVAGVLLMAWALLTDGHQLIPAGIAGFLISMGWSVR